MDMSNLMGLSRILFAYGTYLLDSYCFRSAISLCFISFLWRIWRKRKVKVNCWFCKSDIFIPIDSESWWRCSACDQYNGFKENGDYLEEIPEMFQGPTNQRKFCVTPKEAPKRKNLFCSPCLYNQNRIIEKLADFSPSDDRYFNVELENYKRELNVKFGICIPCKTAISHHLHQQNTHIQEMYIDKNQSSANKPLRKLKVELYKPNLFMIALYELVHICSFLAALWLHKRRFSSDETDLVLSFACLVFSLSTFFIYIQTRKYNLFGILLSFIWFVLFLYGSYSTRDSRDLRVVALLSIITIEGFYLIYKLASFIIKLWNLNIYKQERRKKVEKISGIPMQDQADFSHDMVVGVKKKGAQAWLIKEKIQASSDISKDKISAGPRRPSTPDLLEGHLDAMYIERGSQENLTAKTLKDVNHVVAALKYRSISQPRSERRCPGQPILRPATFIASPRNYVSKVTSETKECIKIKQENLAEGKQGKINISKQNKTVSYVMFNWTNIIICGFILSVIFNLFFVFKILYVSK